MATRWDFESEADDLNESWELFHTDEGFQYYIELRAKTHAKRHPDFDKARFINDCKEGL